MLGLDSARQGQEVRSRVGYVAERPTLYDWMTLSEIGWFTAGFYGSGFFDRYLRLAEGYQLPPKRKIKSLSKGMRAKVSLAWALAHEPELLVLGYLRNQRLITNVHEVESITVDWEVGAAAVKTRSGIANIEAKTASKVVTTGCGQGSVFGSLMADVDKLVLPPATLTQEQL